MSSWPTNPQPVDWEAYRLSVASIQEQQAAQAEQAAAQAESPHQAAIATRKRAPKPEPTDG